MKILIVNGPNLNLLGKRDQSLYGSVTLKDIETIVTDRAKDLRADVGFFQSNTEGLIVDFIQSEAPNSDGMVINPGALTHYGLALREALVDSGLPTMVVHLTNIYARESWRHKSVIAPIAQGQISGLGWRGYVAALEFLISIINEGAVK